MTVEEKEQGIKDAVKKIRDVIREQTSLIKDKYGEDITVRSYRDETIQMGESFYSLLRVDVELTPKEY